jgi:hypothetical protein
LVIRVDQATVNLIIQAALAPGAIVPFTLDQVVTLPGFTALEALLITLPGYRSSPAIEGTSVGEVKALEDAAALSAFPPVHSLISYFFLDLRPVTAPVDVVPILTDLNSPAHPRVEAAYLERDLREAGAWAVTTNDPFVERQGYLRGGVSGPYAYQGINVRNAAVWGKYNGAGMGLVDLERGWNFGHDDLPQAVHLLYNNNRYTPIYPERGDHGTAVLGIVVGVDNGQGILGIAPGARFLRAVSRFKAEDDQWDIVGAILAALHPGVMAYGDVLLLEVETVADKPIRGYPIEIVDHWFDAIRLVVGNGRVVIEPAGNGTLDSQGNDLSRDLDKLAVDWPDAPAWRSINRHDPHFLDSGAIMVSACASSVAPPAAHERLPYAGYGTRVDCYAWGENVFTTGDGDAEGDPNDENTWYTDSFGGTSSASAIIAGAAILVQEMAQDIVGFRISPAKVRMLLSHPNLGTRIVDTDHITEIGVMPDLVKVAAQIGLLPEVYIRDAIGDMGEVPSARVHQSPDIIVTQNQSANPANDYGPTSATAEAIPRNDEIVPGQVNYIYIRMRNRAAVPAIGVTATVYWSEASSLVAPVHWHLIGTTQPVTVPGAPTLTVAGPIHWNPQVGSLPPSNHGCFVAILDHPLDPAPPLLPANDPSGAGPTSWNDFLSYVGNNNNVAWRNFSVLAANPTTAGFQASAWFVIRGAGEEASTFTFEILQRLPRGAQVGLEVPRALALQLRRFEYLRPMPGHEARDTVRLLVRPRRFLRLKDLELETREGYSCVLRVDFPKGIAFEGQNLSLRQYYRGKEVGRLTWEFARGEGE